MDTNQLKTTARGALRPLVLLLDSLGFSPLAVTLLGLALSFLGAWLVAIGQLFLGAIVFLVGSGFDMLDGDLARRQGTVSRRGAFLDSCLDRFGEAAMLTAVAAWCMDSMPSGWQTGVVLILVTMFGSLATSYVRARAEGLGETCLVGVLQRTERVIILSVGVLLGWWLLRIVLWVLAILTLVTVLQRITHVGARLTSAAPAVGVPATDADPPADVEADGEVWP